MLEKGLSQAVDFGEIGRLYIFYDDLTTLSQLFKNRGWVSAALVVFHEMQEIPCGSKLVAAAGHLRIFGHELKYTATGSVPACHVQLSGDLAVGEYGSVGLIEGKINVVPTMEKISAGQVIAAIVGHFVDVKL